MHCFEDAQVAVQLVARRVVAYRPARADLDRARANAVDDACRAPKELDEVIDQVGMVEVNGRHCRRSGPELPQRGRISHCGHDQMRVN